MMKFCTAAILSCMASAGDGTFRMKANSIRAEKGGLADVMHDTSFKLDNGNPSYLFMDTSAFFDEPSNSLK